MKNCRTITNIRWPRETINYKYNINKPKPTQHKGYEHNKIHIDKWCSALIAFIHSHDNIVCLYSFK